jgi:DNA recombination-dependent growth factor C
MQDVINPKLLKYLSKKNQKHIIQLDREYGNKISFVMEWEDGFQRSRMADNIAEMKEMIEMLEENREAQF